MAVKVKNSNVGIAPRKIRQVCDLIRNKKASEAIKILRFCEKKEIAIILTKLINSGLAIANESNKYDLDNLVVGTIFTDEGQCLRELCQELKVARTRLEKEQVTLQ